MSSSTKPTILLVHGAWHGSWCWKYQVPELEALGYTVEAVDLPSASGTPGKTQINDADCVRSSLEALLAAGKRVVVLAHSYGGPIAGAAVVGMSQSQRAAENLEGGVLGMIALSAYMFPGGMDQGAVIRSMGGLPHVDWDSPSEGLFVAKDPGSLLFPPDMPKDREQWMLSQLRPQSMAASMGIVPPQVWETDHFKTPLGYIQTSADAIVPITDQEKTLDVAGGKDQWVVRRLEGSGHSPQVSRPREVAVAVESIVQEFEANASQQGR